MISKVHLLDSVMGRDPPPFALLHRPDAVGRQRMELLIGEVTTPSKILEIPLTSTTAGPALDVVVLVPYRQIAERGFACIDDRAPLIALRVTEQAVLPAGQVFERITESPLKLVAGAFDPDDGAYAECVSRVVTDEIGAGAGSNFVIKRSYVACIPGYTVARALTLFRRLCAHETGAYWTFVVHTGSRTFVGATPERHASLRERVVVMNPISGTYRYPATGPSLAGVLQFLEDGKENDELKMVVDEELKMMARLCEHGGRVRGPFLKEMARLAHTEYLIEGRSARDPREILRETMFAPTVIGSPLENAFRVIERYEPAGRGYYSGIVAAIGRDDRGDRFLDSAILIRTADIDRGGRLTIGVGATIVRLSQPASEVAETRAKAAGLLAALGADPAGVLGADTRATKTPWPRAGALAAHSDVQEALRRRNDRLATFWFAGSPPVDVVPALRDRRVLVVDAEDAFTAMIAHQLRALGAEVTVRLFHDAYSWEHHDAVVMGPGPGDPRHDSDRRIAHLYTAIFDLLNTGRPFLAVCLSHQVLSRLIGLKLARCAVCHQGTQLEIDLFGERELVGFYNTFAAYSLTDRIELKGVGLIEVSRDARSGEVYALRGPRFTSMQFHAESILTQNGPRIFANRIKEILVA